MKNDITSIIGLSKNAGKTTLLNYLIKQSEQEGMKLGIASIGIDGEKVDLLTGQPKPLIMVPTGTLVATTEDGLKEGTANWRILDRIDCTCSIKRIYLAEATEEGSVKLIGTHTVDIISNILEFFKQYNAEKIIVDGAYDRFSSASPTIANQVYLVIGASLHQDQRQLWGIVNEKLSRFFYPRTSDEEVLQIIKQWDEQTLLIKQDEIWVKYPANYLILNKDINFKNTEKLLLPGVLLEKNFLRLLQEKKGFDIILQNGLKSFIPSNLVEKWQKKGGSIQVINNINIKGIAYNPYSPSGYSFSSFEMKQKIEEILANNNNSAIPVFNVWTEEVETIKNN